MCIQADELYVALMRRPAGFTVLYMLAPWAVPEGVAVPYEVYLAIHKQSAHHKTHFNHLH